MRKIIVANWKMNGSLNFVSSFVTKLQQGFSATPNQIIICPPFLYLAFLKTALEGTSASVGAQNCHNLSQGAFTGEVSSFMLADLGCKAVIVGHSERRSFAAETDSMVAAKAAAVHEAGMTAIICVGESYAVRESGQAMNWVVQQLHASLPPSATPQNTYVAYEPIWAIGTGMTAHQEDIKVMHQALHQAMGTPIPLLYGGSVTDQNVGDILCLPHVEGVLVGGASLKTDVFERIITSHL